MGRVHGTCRRLDAKVYKSSEINECINISFAIYRSTSQHHSLL